MDDRSPGFDRRGVTQIVEAKRDEHADHCRTANHICHGAILVSRGQTHDAFRVGTHSAARRVFDVAFALAGFLVLAGPIAVIAMAVCIESGRPVFFSQTRLGRRGRHFRLYKFRKFHRDADAGGRAVTVKDDSRLTRVGNFLERTKLNELPQLWNVLKGDMSMVGPRPETLNFADCFRDGYQRVLDYKPGIFGPSQVFFRNESALYPAGCDPHQFYRDILFPLKACIDLAYFPDRNMYSDIAWMFRGVLAVFGGLSFRSEGMYSVEELEGWIGTQERGRRKHAAGGIAITPERAPLLGVKLAPRNGGRGSVVATQAGAGSGASLFVRSINHIVGQRKS